MRYHINCCPKCVLTKQPRRKQRWKLRPITPGRRLFEVINVDNLEPFIKRKSGNVYILVIVDNLTKLQSYIL